MAIVFICYHLQGRWSETFHFKAPYDSCINDDFHGYLVRAGCSSHNYGKPSEFFAGLPQEEVMCCTEGWFETWNEIRTEKRLILNLLQWQIAN